jgi:hypothetical protein
LGTIKFPTGLLEIANQTLLKTYHEPHIVQYCSLVFEIFEFPYHRQQNPQPKKSFTQNKGGSKENPGTRHAELR